MNAKEIVSELKRRSSPRDREGMARFGIDPKYALGVRVPVLRSLAKKAGKNHELASHLWASRIHEARILASMVEESEKVKEGQVERWVRAFNSWDLCDQCCLNLFDRLPFAFRKAIEWPQEKKEFVRRAGFALMACLAWHSKGSSDKEFLKFFPVIKKHSKDERNFVKKAVNWALRQIGKRNLNLNKRAIEVAREIQKINSPTARWIASDAIRELTDDKVRTRLVGKG